MKNLLHRQSEKKLTSIKDRIEFNDLELYIFDTFTYSSKILNTLELFNLIIKWIGKFHPEFNKDYKFEKISKTDGDEIQYHIENFYIRTIKLKDQILLFINQLFDLNLESKKCNYDNILKSIKSKIIEDEFYDANGIIILQLIKDLKQKFSKIEKYRNFIAHRGEYKNDDLNLIQGVLYFKELEKKGDYPKSLFENQMPEKDFNNILKGFIFTTIWDFRKYSNILNDWTFSFYKFSDSVFIKICEEKAETLTANHSP